MISSALDVLTSQYWYTHGSNTHDNHGCEVCSDIYILKPLSRKYNRKRFGKGREQRTMYYVVPVVAGHHYNNQYSLRISIVGIQMASSGPSLSAVADFCMCSGTKLCEIVSC